MLNQFNIIPFCFGAAYFGVAWAMRPFEGNIWQWPVMISAGVAGWILSRFLVEGLGKLLLFQCQRELRSLPLDEISKRIGDVATPEWSLALLELKARGDDLTAHRSRMIDLLCDDSYSCRVLAFRAMSEVFGHDVEKLEGYSPYDSAEKCRDKAYALWNTGRPT